MPAKQEPSNNLYYGWGLGENNWKDGMDNNLKKVGSTLNPSVLAIVSSPLSTSNGTKYLISGGIGDFSGQVDGTIVIRIEGQWVFYSLPEGTIVYNQDDGLHYKVFSGGIINFINVVGVGATAFVRYDTGQSLSESQREQFYENTAVLQPTINNQSGTAYTLGTVAADNNGKTYLRMTNAAANTVTIPSTQTKPISISQSGTGTTTLAAGAGVTLNGTLAFSAQYQTKSIIPLGSGVFDVVG